MIEILRIKQIGYGQCLRYYFVILPPLRRNETCRRNGLARSGQLRFPSTSISCPTDQGWFYQNGQHWIEKTPYECPRQYQDEFPCPICDLGVLDTIASRPRYAINAYFPTSAKNPTEVAGRVMVVNLVPTMYRVLMLSLADYVPKYRCGCKVEAAPRRGWNSYTGSRAVPLSPESYSRILTPEILAQRAYLPDLFPERNLESLRLVASGIRKEGGPQASVPPPPPKESNLTPKESLRPVPDIFNAFLNSFLGQSATPADEEYLDSNKGQPFSPMGQLARNQAPPSDLVYIEDASAGSFGSLAPTIKEIELLKKLRENELRKLDALLKKQNPPSKQNPRDYDDIGKRKLDL